MDEIKEIKEWIVDYLEKPSDNFGGMPVCPFVKKERMTERLLIDVWKPDEKSFLDLLERLNESEQYTSALLICKDSEDIKWEEVDRKKFQKSIQVLMEDKGYKNLKALSVVDVFGISPMLCSINPLKSCGVYLLPKPRALNCV